MPLIVTATVSAHTELLVTITLPQTKIVLLSLYRIVYNDSHSAVTVAVVCAFSLFALQFVVLVCMLVYHCSVQLGTVVLAVLARVVAPIAAVVVPVLQCLLSACICVYFWLEQLGDLALPALTAVVSPVLAYLRACRIVQFVISCVFVKVSSTLATSILVTCLHIAFLL
jgi:hypothetical protein